MAANKTTDKPSSESPEIPDARPVQMVSQVVPAEVVPATIFRDKVFTSRTLILPGGGQASVAKGQIAASTSELLAYLNAHKDFEPLLE
ncbi:hypothetical protein [Pseudomonas caspiana]|uniref:hypothetical protein n=1 Tax=Pseudomonas caspiana TaxID=1451454 RepID=UPI00385B0B0B